MNVAFDIDFAPLIKQMQELKKLSAEQIQLAKERVAMMMLTLMNTEAPKPPIRWGVLRGSASAFVGGKLVGVGQGNLRAGAEEKPTPALSYSAPDEQLTVVYNTSYAAKMHEWTGGWGPYTLQDGNAGAKWIEGHVMKDGPRLMAQFAKDLREWSK